MNTTSLSYTIYTATLEDVPAIRQMAVFTWWTVYPAILSANQIEYMLDELYNEEILKEFIQTEKQTFLILSEDDGPKGFAAYGPLPENDDIFKIYKIYVLPKNHSMGYGKALLSKVADIAIEAGKKLLELNVNRNNPAKLFYERFGFKIIEEVDIPIGPFWMNDYVMQLDLDSIENKKPT
ncbi:GNAT family N-acetyltransferase [soil metagenome]